MNGLRAVSGVRACLEFECFTSQNGLCVHEVPLLVNSRYGLGMVESESWDVGVRKSCLDFTVLQFLISGRQ